MMVVVGISMSAQWFLMRSVALVDHFTRLDEEYRG
jgi:hypothetical protein